MVMETEKVILTDLIDNIGVITLNKPEQHNTFDIRFARKLNDALWEFEHNEKVKVVVIQAEGKHFSTGISLNEFKDKSSQEYRNFLHLMDEHNHPIARMKKIVIASVQGYAVANGAGLAFASDFTIAFASLCTTQDAEEGVKAFLEKRKPKWTEK
jgi:enoyl-CoA hydratase/carnithine racemase